MRGLPPFCSSKYDLEQHPNYKYTAETNKKRKDEDILNYDDVDDPDALDNRINALEYSELFYIIQLIYNLFE